MSLWLIVTIAVVWIGLSVLVIALCVMAGRSDRESGVEPAAGMRAGRRQHRRIRLRPVISRRRGQRLVPKRERVD